MRSYLGGGYSPNLEVVWSHKQIGNTSTHHSNNPLVEVCGLVLCGASYQSSVNHAINAFHLLFGWQHGDVVLEWIWDPEVLASHVRDTFMGIPIILLGQCLIDTIIEVLVVGEDNVATNIIQLSGRQLAINTRNWEVADLQNPLGLHQ
jgi:hypothetical protein